MAWWLSQVCPRRRSIYDSPSRSLQRLVLKSGRNFFQRGGKKIKEVAQEKHSDKISFIYKEGTHWFTNGMSNLKNVQSFIFFTKTCLCKTKQWDEFKATLIDTITNLSSWERSEYELARWVICTPSPGWLDGPRRYDGLTSHKPELENLHSFLQRGGAPLLV